jgi:5'-3' exoribonuclease 1
MGIPAYFSYIIKNYSNILRKFQKGFAVNQLYLDSNSVVYDSMREIEYIGNNADFERKLVSAVCKKIENYIQQISPTHLVYIAFDGVAPVAKLNQQKNRRYKSWFMGQYEPSVKPMWDRTAITPGTEFMNKLNLQVRYHFRKPSTFNVKQVIISGSDFPGEGEHKIFEYIREHTDELKNLKSVIYGLDADLIMLTINHLQYCENMYLFRETPDFIKSIDKSLDPNYLYVMDIPQFKDHLVCYLNNDVNPTTDVEKNRVFDYIFLCFMLGNDFLPHFPALNLRTGGMDILMETYRTVLGASKKNIIVDGKIVWKNFRLLVKALADHEESYIQVDYIKRNKQEKRPLQLDENASRFDKEMLHAPSRGREVEKYICPTDKYWESRYYDMLFDVDIDDEWRKKISMNYLEGLEWTWKYYSMGCVDWRWTYKYHYPPLLTDLLKYVPYFETELVEPKVPNPVTELVQLSYVLPKNSLYLLPKRIENKLLHQCGDMYKNNYEYKWAYCKYFWECHVDFPEINLSELEKIVNE